MQGALQLFFDRDTSFAYKRVEHHLTMNPLQRLLHHNVAHPSRRIAVTVGRETASVEAPLFASLCSSRRGSAGLISIVTSHCGRGRSACRNSHQSRARSSLLLLCNRLRNVDRSQACKWPCCSGWTPEFSALCTVGRRSSARSVSYPAWGPTTCTPWRPPESTFLWRKVPLLSFH